MKRKIAIVLAVAMAAACLCLAGCSLCYGEAVNNS